jgi:WD40 repeat protein
MKRIIIAFMLWGVVMHAMHYNVSTPIPHTKRQKINSEVPLSTRQQAYTAQGDKITALILESCTQMPYVLATITLQYLRREEWRESYSLHTLKQHIQHITFRGEEILFTHKNSMHSWIPTNQYYASDTFSTILTNFYSKTYLLQSKNHLSFVVVNTNPSFKKTQPSETAIYCRDSNVKTDPRCIKKYTKVKTLQLSTTTLIGLIINKNKSIIFNTETSEEWTVPTTLQACQLAFSPNSKLLAISGISGIIQIWDTLQRKQIATIPSQQAVAFSGLAIASQGIVASTTTTHIIIHKQNKPDYQSQPIKNRLYPINFSADGTFLVAYNFLSNCIELRDGETGELTCFLHSNNPVRSLSFATGFSIDPNSDRIATTYVGGTLVLWKLHACQTYDIIDH